MSEHATGGRLTNRPRFTQRGECPTCGRDCALRANGTPRKHKCIEEPRSVVVPLDWTRPPLRANDRRHDESLLLIQPPQVTEKVLMPFEPG